MHREFRILRLVALAAATLMPAVAAAQTPPAAKPQPAPQTEHRDPRACAQGQETVGSGGAGKDEKKSESLSEKLARSNGVICPPEHVDPEIKAPTPQGGSMPVIPPPGSPGGNPSVQPK